MSAGADQQASFHFVTGTMLERIVKSGGEVADIHALPAPPGQFIWIRYRFLDHEITSVKILALIDDARSRQSAVDKMVKPLTDAEIAALPDCYDYISVADSSSAFGYLCEFSETVDEDFARRHLGGLPEDSLPRAIRSGRVIATLTRQPRQRRSATRSLVLQGRLCCFVARDEVAENEHGDDNFDDHYSFERPPEPPPEPADDEADAEREIDHVAWSDGLLDREMLADANAVIDRLCEQEPVDHHPGSGTTTRVLVHPSLYCYVHGVSPVIGEPRGSFRAVFTPPPGTESRHDGGRHDEWPRDFWGRAYEDSRFQWLPAEFAVSAEGRVNIASAINNLDRDRHPQAYRLLEGLFERTLPMFEAVCTNLRSDFDGDTFGRTPPEPNPPTTFALRNRRLQVITKIVEYRVGKQDDFSGVWHVEGMPHEEILATALCVVHRSANFEGARIDFRRFFYADEADALTRSVPHNTGFSTDTMDGGSVLSLGKLDTPEGRIVVFPNSHIHRLSTMSSADRKDATRRIIVFWLVNPDRPILSTENVPPQQRTMHRDDANTARLQLMMERKLYKENYSRREISFCEH